MRSVNKSLLILTAVGAANAFVPMQQTRNSAHALFSAVAEEVDTVEEVAAPAEPAAPAVEPTGLRMKDVRSMVDKLSSDNFDATLKEMEPFLVHEAGATLYAKSMRRLDKQAKALGKVVPEGYAKEAKATAKRREKQNAFIQTKEEARLAAEAEAAEAAAAAKSEAEEAAAAAEPGTEEAAEPVAA